MNTPEKHKKHITVHRDLFDEHGNFSDKPETKIVFDSELSKKVTDAVNLLKELGIYQNPDDASKTSKRITEQNEVLNKKLEKIGVMCILALLWCGGSFYSFTIEKNQSVGLLFLGLVIITLAYFVFMVHKKAAE